MPGFWVETLVFWLLGLPTSTSFRMFPPADIVPDYPTELSYSIALMTILHIPIFVSRDRQHDGEATLGVILRPFTRTLSPFMEASVMFARVWLAAAWTNAATAQFMTDHSIQTYSVKIACLAFIYEATRRSRGTAATAYIISY
ncbi:hypothetical protein GQ53DRAFT_829115 [Thozetella sp. PMI_491]|nr:hypothetical protein GQ53DRAFT_829115 [Thozetella sp. PMI_491]